MRGLGVPSTTKGSFFTSIRITDADGHEVKAPLNIEMTVAPGPRLGDDTEAIVHRQ